MNVYDDAASIKDKTVAQARKGLTKFKFVR